MTEQDKAPNKVALIGFAVPTVLLATVGAVLWFKHSSKPMVAYPEMLFLLALMPVLFYLIGSMPRSSARQFVGMTSCVIWILGIGLAFVIPPESNFIYVPDALLMLGFFPLLYLWKYSWPWLVFGLLNLGIGILLMVIEYSPDNLFPADLLKPKHHLADYHPAVVWYTTGVFATMFGVGRMIKNIYKMIARRGQPKSSQPPTEPSP